MIEDEYSHKPLRDEEWPDNPDDMEAPDEDYIICQNCGNEYYWDLPNCPRCGSETAVPESGMIWGWRKYAFSYTAWILVILFIIIAMMTIGLPGIPFWF